MGRKLIFNLFAMVLVASMVVVSGQAMAAEKKKEPPKQYIPLFAYRTGPFQTGGSGQAGG